MSNLYDKGREGFLAGTIDWDSDTIKAILVSAAYVVDLAAHQFLPSVGGGTRVATSGAFTAKTVAAGVADAADVNFPAVSGATIVAIILFKDTGVESTSRLIAYIDEATGLPLIPTGADISIQWDNGANKIFQL